MTNGASITARGVRIRPTRQVRFASKLIRPGPMTMRACSKRVGMTWHGLWRHATRGLADARRSWLLDEFCALSGYTRKHALVLLSDPPAEDRPKRIGGRPRSYGPAEVALLRMCWSATDGICSKRLAPFLPELLERLRHWHALRHVSAATIERVARMSPSTVDRALASSRPGLPKRGISTTRPGTLLKHQVAIKTFADWTETVPGFVEIDLVAHCGWTGAGPFLYTLTLVDVATGWVSCAGLRDKRAQTVLAALHRLHEGLPFRILGLDSDSGSEFLNAPLVEYCAAQRITFTRGRPYRKNDGCFVEQKNWAVVRRLVGYQRLEAPALAALERVHDLSRDYVNFLHPSASSPKRSAAGLVSRATTTRLRRPIVVCWPVAFCPARPSAS